MMPLNNTLANNQMNTMSPMGNNVVNPMQKMNDELTLEMEHTW